METAGWTREYPDEHAGHGGESRLIISKSHACARGLCRVPSLYESRTDVIPSFHSHDC